jgi:hypothetical protein
MKVARTLTIAAATLITTVAASAQSFNIDFGDQGTGLGPPAATFGAASGQAGIWQVIPSVTAAVPIVMNDLTGAATLATITCNNTNANFSFNNVGTNGNDQLLMDDALDMGGAGATDTFTISGLQNGIYSVYTYAWAPDSATFLTTIGINGANQQIVGGAWPNGYVQGVTHALHTNVVVVAGTMTINTSTTSGFSTLNGLQLVIPGPGALALLGLAGVVGSRRRRA